MKKWLNVAVAGAGFLADAYDLFVIDLVIPILREVAVSRGDHIKSGQESLVASAGLLGAVLGQIGFGLAADHMGRRKIFIITGLFVILGSILSSVVQWTSFFPLMFQLAICRFVLGFGIGGEYPLSATVTSEHSETERDKSVATVFSMQGFGMMLSPAVVLILLFSQVPKHVIWRISLALGALPSALVFYWRFKMEESKVFQEAVEIEMAVIAGETPKSSHLPDEDDEDMGKLESAASTKSSFESRGSLLRRHVPHLIGTMLAWFLIDVSLYGTGSFKSAVADATLPRTKETLHIYKDALFGFVTALLALPGYILTVCFVERLSCRTIQLNGFVVISILFLLMGFHQLFREGKDFIIVVFAFAGTFLFSNFGPNATTFILPAKIFPPLIRATCHGLSAASGKVGGALGAGLFSPVRRRFGMAGVMFSYGGVAGMGAISTLFFTKSEKRTSLAYQEISPVSVDDDTLDDNDGGF